MNTTTKTKLTKSAIAQFDAHFDTPIADHLLIPSDSAVEMEVLGNGKTNFTIGRYAIRLPSETPITVFSDDCDESWIAVVKLTDDYSMPNPITFTFDAESIAEDMDNHFDMYTTFCIQLRGDNLFICSQKESSHVWKRYSIAELLNDEVAQAQAKLVKNRFAIDFESDNEIFEGYHNPNYRWNGWAVPLFTKKVMETIIEKFSTEDYPIVFEENYSEDTDETTSVVVSSKLTSPNGERLYITDGWCWGELD